jgi:hypothetical protein
MRGRVNMPPDAVIALVHAIKMHHNELRDHSKVPTYISDQQEQGFRYLKKEI